MAFRNKNYLTEKFEDNDIPTGQDFSDLISSSLNNQEVDAQFLSSSLTVSGALDVTGNFVVSGAIAASGTLDVVGDISCSSNLNVSGNVFASSYNLEGFNFADVNSINTSGSTTFGDTASQDVHRRTGSVFVTGSYFNITSSDFKVNAPNSIAFTTPSIEFKGEPVTSFTVTSSTFNITSSNINVKSVNNSLFTIPKTSFISPTEGEGTSLSIGAPNKFGTSYALFVSSSNNTIANFETHRSTGKVRIAGNTSSSHSPSVATVLELQSNTVHRGAGVNMKYSGVSTDGEWYAGTPYLSAGDFQNTRGRGYQIGFDKLNGRPHYRISASLTISESGNIGINKVKPLYKLDIGEGELRIQPPSHSSGIKTPQLILGNVINAYQSGIVSTTHLTSIVKNTAGGFYWYRSSSLETSGAGKNWMTLSRVGGTAAANQKGILMIGATSTANTQSIGGKDTLFFVNGNITASGVLMASASHAPAHGSNILAVVYDTGSRQFHYTGSYGAGSSGTSGIFRATGSFENTTVNVGVTGSFAVKGGIYTSDKIRIGGTDSGLAADGLSSLSGQTSIIHAAENIAGMTQATIRNLHPIESSTGWTSGGSIGTQLRLDTDSNNGIFTVYTPGPNDSGIDHRVDFGSTAGASFLTFSPGNTIRMTINNDGKVGIGRTATTYELEVAGNMAATLDVIAYMSSDKRLKDNIKPIENPIEKIKQIGGYTFDWNNNQSTYEGNDVGVIAQEIEAVLPSLVNNREDGYKGVKYDKIVSLLIEGIKDQQNQIDDLKEQINNLK